MNDCKLQAKQLKAKHVWQKASAKPLYNIFIAAAENYLCLINNLLIRAIYQLKLFILTDYEL